MTQIFSADGQVFPVTVVSAGPVMVTKVLTAEKNGYSALQVGYEEIKKDRLNKARKGDLAEMPGFSLVREFRVTDEAAKNLKQGDQIDVSQFSLGETVSVSGLSKGKGFQGVVKRHGFAGGRRSHGQKHSEREAGSIGATWPQRVLKGKRMAGRMGGDKITVKNLKILGVDKEANTLLISGALPGRRGTVLEVISKQA